MSKADVIIALDLSGKTGFCIGAERPERWGVLHMPDTFENRGQWWAALRNEFCVLMQEAFTEGPKAKPDVARLGSIAEVPPLPTVEVVIENTLPAFRQTHAATATQQMGLAVVVELAAYDEKVPVITVSPSTVRSRVMGPGNGKMTKKEKEGGAIVRWLQARGYSVYDHNAADAILMWMHRRGMKNVVR